MSEIPTWDCDQMGHIMVYQHGRCVMCHENVYGPDDFTQWEKDLPKT